MPIVSFIPVMLFAILFGLSMDYNVFLLSRVHEAYNEGDGPRDSVIHGMARIGKVILFAGLIMAAVFLAFVTQPDVVGEDDGPRPRPRDPDRRALRAPGDRSAVVTLLGDKAWWLPGWLDRILPNVSLEGTSSKPSTRSSRRSTTPSTVQRPLRQRRHGRPRDEQGRRLVRAGERFERSR